MIATVLGSLATLLAATCDFPAPGAFARSLPVNLAHATPARAEDGFAGTFKGGVITLELRQEGHSVKGTMRLRTASFAVQGTVAEGVLRGQYENAGNWVAFVATLDEDNLVLESGGAKHKLTREPTSDAGNPLSDPGLSRADDEATLSGQPAKEGERTATASSATAASSPLDAPTDELPRRFIDPRGLSIGVPRGWIAQDAKALTILAPPLDQTTGQPAFVCNVNLGAWAGESRMDDPATLNQLATMITGSMPQVRQEGQPELVGHGEQDGARLAFAMPTPGGTIARFHAYAKLRSGKLILMLVFGNETVVKAEDTTIRRVFRSIELDQPALGHAGAEASMDPALRARYPHVLSHRAGFSIRYPNEWTPQEEAARVTFHPPFSVNAPELTIQADAQPWSAPIPVTAPEAMRDVERQFSAAFQGFLPDGAPEVLADQRGARFRFLQAGAGESARRVTVFVKSVSGVLITVAAVGHAGTVLSAEPIAADMFTTAAPLAAAGVSPETTAKFPEVLQIAGSGYTIRYPAGWLAQGNGPAAVIAAPAPPGQPPTEMYTLTSMPWIAGMSLDDPASAEQAAAMFTQAMPGIQREGPVEPLGSGRGVLMRYTGTAPNGQPYKLRMLARSGDQAAVFMLFMSDAQTAASRELLARDMFQTLEITGVPRVPTQQAAPLGTGYNQATSGPAPQAAPSPSPIGQLDPQLIGQWSSSSAMSSPAPWGDMGQGGTSFVTQTVYVFGADGTFMLGSRAAGGNNDVSGQTGFSISSAGRWAAAASPQGNYILLQHQNGETSRVRYTFHEGQLVLGEPGGRSFWSRAQ